MHAYIFKHCRRLLGAVLAPTGNINTICLYYTIRYASEYVMNDTFELYGLQHIKVLLFVYKTQPQHNISTFTFTNGTISLPRTPLQEHIPLLDRCKQPGSRSSKCLEVANLIGSLEGGWHVANRFLQLAKQ